jgi:hypothetical protein
MAGATGADLLRSGLNLMRRLPPRDVKTNLVGLTGVPPHRSLCWTCSFVTITAVLRPELTEEFLQRVDQPLQTRIDPVTKRAYIL